MLGGISAGLRAGAPLSPAAFRRRPAAGRAPLPPLLAVAAAALSGGVAAAARGASHGRRIDAHLHLWTPDTATYPCSQPLPEHLSKDGRATHENFVRLMDEAGVSEAVVVQPINYGQDYRYLVASMNAHPTRLKGVFIADPSVPAADAADWVSRTAASHSGFVGVRFNPYLFPQDGEQAGMANDVGLAMFRRAGELRLVVGFMAFKGLARHMAEIEALLKSSPDTKVVIDHWGFFLQPATGLGTDRAVEEESWEALLRLAVYPQVSVKISAMFRASTEPWPWASLSDRLRVLLDAFGSQRLLWGSDFPFVTEHAGYGRASVAVEEWPIWKDMSAAQRDDVLAGTAARLYGLAAADQGGKEFCA